MRTGGDAERRQASALSLGITSSGQPQARANDRRERTDQDADRDPGRGRLYTCPGVTGQVSPVGAAIPLPARLPGRYSDDLSRPARHASCARLDVQRVRQARQHSGCVSGKPATPERTNERHGSGERRPGDDYNERGDYESVLYAAGWQPLRDMGGKKLWQRPGKSGVGISATSNYADRALFHVFSTNAAPFEPETSYSPFAVYTLLEHGGDYEVAARKLRTLGYGATNETAVEVLGGNGSQAPPVQKHAPQWPTCEPEAFHGLAGEIVRAIEPHTEADSVGLLIQLLIAFGNAVAPSAHFLAEADKHHGNLFAVMVGVSSKGRKGTSWGYIRELFKLAEPGWAEQCVKSGLSSGEGLIHHVRDAVEKEKTDKKTGEVEIVVEDEGVSDKRLLVLETEFTTVLKQTDRDGNTLSATVRNAWDTGSLQCLTKNSPVRATGAHISIIGHITKDELKRELSATETANGFGNRFLWACVRRSKELPEGGKFRIHEQVELIARLQAAIENASETSRLDRDSGARAVWLAIYHDLSTGKPGLCGALTGRSEAQVMRLALLYALLDQAAVICAEHLTAAIALWEYCEASVRYVFGDSLGDRVADEILQMLRQAQTGMSRNEIRDSFGRNRSSQQIGSSLALLAEVGAARCESRNETGAGRPTEFWIATR